MRPLWSGGPMDQFRDHSPSHHIFLNPNTDPTERQFVYQMSAVKFDIYSSFLPYLPSVKVRES